MTTDAGINRTAEVSVIIVNWNSGRLLGECLASLRAAANGLTSIETIVIDNASQDVSMAAAEADSKVTILRNPANRGFGAACNRGAAAASGRGLLFLNPDCRVGEGSIDAAWGALNRDVSVGAVGVALTGDDRRVSRSCHRFPGPREFFFRLSGLAALSPRFGDGAMRSWEHDEDRFVDHVIGAFYLVRAEDFRTLGGFDERYFVYLEDLDLSLRYAQRGQRCLFLASPASYHKGGGVSERARETRLAYATRSRVLYAFKHFSRGHAWLHLLATCVLEPPARLLGVVLRGRPAEAGEICRGFARFYRELPEALRIAHKR